RFAPGNLLAEGWFQISLVGGARPGRNGTHTLVSHHLPPGFDSTVRWHGPFAPAVFIHAADVERRGNDDPRAKICQPFGIFKRGFALVNRAVKMSSRNVHQRFSAADFSHPRDD